MKYINMVVKANATYNLFGKVSDEVWEKYQNGEITLNDLYYYYFSIYDKTILDYDITDITHAEED